MTRDEFAERIAYINERHGLSLDPSDPRAVDNEVSQRGMRKEVSNFVEPPPVNTLYEFVRLFDADGNEVAHGRGHDVLEATTIALERFLDKKPIRYF